MDLFISKFSYASILSSSYIRCSIQTFSKPLQFSLSLAVAIQFDAILFRSSVHRIRRQPSLRLSIFDLGSKSFFLHLASTPVTRRISSFYTRVSRSIQAQISSFAAVQFLDFLKWVLLSFKSFLNAPPTLHSKVPSRKFERQKFQRRKYLPKLNFYCTIPEL